MKVYILYGDECDWYSHNEVYAITLDASLKDDIFLKYKHDFPRINFSWDCEEAIVKTIDELDEVIKELEG